MPIDYAKVGMFAIGSFIVFGMMSFLIINFIVWVYTKLGILKKKGESKS